MTRFLPLLLLVVSATVLAQPLDFVRLVDRFEVRDLDGERLPYPFVGGFGGVGALGPRSQLIDMDADGDADLLTTEGASGLAYYENVGPSGPGLGFLWRTDALSDIRPGTWFTAGDLDGDGDFDLLTQGAPGRVRYYRNVGTAQSAAYELAVDELMAVGGESVSNEDTSVPRLADIDGDGDLDFLHGQADRGHITLFRNVGVQDGIPQFEFITNDWEGIEVFEPNPTCEEPKDGPPSTTGFIEGRGSLHGANALTLADLDDDNDLELFWGDFFARSLFYYRNDGSPTTPDFTLVSEFFPLDEPLTSGGYNVPSYGDVDQDGDLDLVIGILGGLCSSVVTKFDNFFFYENTGTPQDATFALRSERLISSVEVGDRAVPALGDIDGDGDLDLVIGNDPLGLLGSQLIRYENQGTSEAPIFRQVDPDWLGLEFDFGAYAPVFVDIDADDDLDLIVGGFNGRLAFYENQGTPTVPDYVLLIDGDGDPVEYQNIDVGQYIRPAFGDIDGDGDQDLLTGESNGRLRLYRNAGTPQNAAFETAPNGAPTEADDAFRDAIGLGLDLGSDSSPRLVDLDQDGDLDMISGTAEGDLVFYRNTGSATNPQYAQDIGIPAFRPSTTPVLGDLDGDGDLDILAGTKNGGLMYWENSVVGNPGVEPGLPGGRSFNLRAVPNPSNGRVTFHLDEPVPSGDDAELVVYDTLGQKIAALSVQDGSREVVWDNDAVDALASGYYLARLEGADRILASTSFTRVR